MPGQEYLVCSLPEDGKFTFAGTDQPFEYVSRDVWSDGSVTYNGADGSRFTQAFHGDVMDRAYYLTYLCGNIDPYG